MTTSTIDKLAYGRKLVDAGVAGIRAGHRNFDPAKASSLMADSAEKSLKLAAMGAFLGMLPALLLQRRTRFCNAMLFGTIGGILGFTAGFSWKTRSLTSSLAHSAMHEVHRVQDEHWLEENPVDYA